MADEILMAMQEAVRNTICEAANEEIKKQRERFEEEMEKAKRETVCKIVNQIQIAVEHNPLSGEYVVQLRLNGGSRYGK